MADDAHFLSAHPVQLFQGVHDGVQVVVAQGAEPFVDEQGVYREALPAEGREAEGKRQRDQDSLAS